MINGDEMKRDSEYTRQWDQSLTCIGERLGVILTATEFVEKDRP